MTYDNDKRRRLLGRLRRGLAGSVPILALAAGGISLVDDEHALESREGAWFLSSAHAEGGAEAEGGLEAQSEAEAEAEGEAEGVAEGEAASAEAVRRPDGYSPAYSETGDNPREMLARGEALYYDTSLSGNGLACASCHGSDGNDVGYQATFAEPFPHEVAMARDRFGMNQVHADEMVQICMVAPMEAEPLAWGSEALTSLAAYMVEVQKRVAGESHDL